ncbi:MAG: hypothetical protein R3A10_04645 [Caldilineaceae bacterium]
MLPEFIDRLDAKVPMGRMGLPGTQGRGRAVGRRRGQLHHRAEYSGRRRLDRVVAGCAVSMD